MNKLLVSPSPHIHSPLSTKRLMLDVVIALIPSVIVSLLFYGWHAVIVLASSLFFCVATEYVVTKYLMKKPSTIGDMSAVVTGILLALNLPPTAPWWIAMIGAFVAIGVTKMTFGGLGQNLFNPAITGRVFLLISFPVIMTNWDPVKGFINAGFTGAVDATSGETPLGIVKEGLAQGLSLDQIYAERGFDYMEMFFTNIGGSAGEISAIAILIGFIYLLARKVIRPHITLSIWATVIVFSGIFWLVDLLWMKDVTVYTDPLFQLLTGGVLLGSVFMATDYVTSPMSDKGGIIFGIGIGLITMLIRYFGSYPEGMSFAILLMNSTVPLINKFCKQKKFGRA